MEWVVQKATELGVSRIIPLELSRSIVKLDGKKRTERQQRWQKVAAEAARQSGRLTIPTVMQPMNLTSFLQQLTEADKLLVPWEDGGMPLRQALTKLPPEPEGMVYFMIGPEGGLTTAEVQQAKGLGGQNVTLGPRILRTETAGLALLAILQYEWGDVGQ
jgi:16S rRNA (uracil1498-N3)-methyltransferase